jgi:NAD dependent epimerase/dehydratase
MSAVHGRSVVVTGAGGFIGGHLTAALVLAGARVRGFYRYNSRNDRGTLDWFAPSIVAEVEVLLGDLRDVESVARSIKGAELVFHLGAQIAIPYSYANPRDFFETNVLGSLNVAQAALEHGVHHLIHVSTSEVYGSAQTVPINEAHPLEARSPYAASKIGADKLVESFHHTYDLPATVVRPFNTYGPHQSARAIIPTVISQALASDTLRLGSLEPRRDLTYVTDTVAGLIAAAVTPATIGRTIQLGTGAEASVVQIVDRVGEILGRQLTVRRHPQRVRPPSSEVQRLISDPALATELMGWTPHVTLSEGLAATIEWIAANQDRYRVTEYVI